LTLTLRFATARDLYEAFPTARDDVGVDASDEPSLAFLELLASMQVWDAAISFCAYLLRRREAVWWGCQSLRRMIELTPDESDLLGLAEDWVGEPDDEHRWAALDAARMANTLLPATWMALGVGWSGGSIIRPQHGRIAPAPEQTARAVRAGLMIGITRVPSDHIETLMVQCLSQAKQVAAGAPPA
jgi:hypothetical protein